MRLFYYLTGFAFVLAGGSGFLLWQANHVAPDVSNIGNQVAQIKNEFQQLEKPVQELNIEKFRQQRIAKDLIDPQTTLPQYSSFPFEEVSSLHKYAQSCKNGSSLQLKSKDLQKAVIWQRFVCEDSSRLPSDFFSMKPMMHPSGASYIALALRSGRKEFMEPNWIEKNQNKLHLLEVVNQFSNTNSEIRLSAWELQNILNNEPFVRNKDFVLMAQQNSKRTDDVTYAVFPNAIWTRFVENKNFVPKEIESPGCLLKEGNVCWAINSSVQAAYSRALLAILFGCFSLLGLILIVVLIKRSKQQKIDAEKRLFTLQMLTHELRTPATSLHLSVETLRNEFDQLPPESQKSFLRICDELQRLDRVVDASKQYLQVNHDVAQEKGKSASINAMVESMLAPYGNQIQFHPLAKDIQANINQYWLELSVKNLVENAIHHGKPPVTVELSEKNNTLMIAIMDQGKVSASFDEMLTPFHKGSSSKGLGLGLAIVKKIITTMNGELTFKSNPTTFSIRLKGHK